MPTSQTSSNSNFPSDILQQIHLSAREMTRQSLGSLRDIAESFHPNEEEAFKEFVNTWTNGITRELINTFSIEEASRFLDPFDRGNTKST